MSHCTHLFISNSVRLIDSFHLLSQLPDAHYFQMKRSKEHSQNKDEYMSCE